MEKRYYPEQVEKKWMEYWEEKGYSSPYREGTKGFFSLVMPPPNITGVLHMGHALNNTLQDILTRFKRMQGYQVLWIPGIDHAGIATQNVLERELSRQGLDRQGLGREEFIKRIWDWKSQYGDRITFQLRHLGVSCYWPDLAFTMDPQRSRAVREVFVRLYQEGYIYRGDYIINWCPRCQTALSDIEVEYEESTGKLYYVKYPFRDGSFQGKKNITVATTRPETLLGDAAVAVHPKDERFRGLEDRILLLPLLNREIPLILDEYVDPNFGTGALKVTPAHAANDFLIAQRHHLPSINIFNPDASINEKGEIYQGLNRYQAREKVVEDLRREGYLEKIEEHSLRLGHCYRCGTEVEPYLSRQWFVRMKKLAAPAVEAVKNGQIKIIPSYWQKSYFDWLERIHDWCISRQIWWGHRLPVWYCQDCEEILVSLDKPGECRRCHSSNLKQEEDVLDTWFSSSLWPFSTLGWPETSEKFNKFYPTSLLCSGWDILFFWVVRMVMMGLKFTGRIPFHQVYIHPLIGDEKGEKMSKSKGNVVNPLLMIKKYGADAFRFSLIALKTETPYLRFSQERVAGYRNFANKIWNASRFVLMNLKGFTPPEKGWIPSPVELSDRWILSRYHRLVSEVTQKLEDFQFPQAAGIIYQFIWGEFCDWYIELVKPRLAESSLSPTRSSAQQILWYILKSCLKLLHPFMPFITEDIYQRLPGTEESIMISSWPSLETKLDSEAEREMDLLIEVIREVRTIRAEMLIPPQKKIDLFLRSPDEFNLNILTNNQDYLLNLVNINQIKLRKDTSKPAFCASSVVGETEIFIPLEGLIDLEKEKVRLKRNLDEIKLQLQRTSKKLASSQFLEKAPPQIIQKEKEKKEELKRKFQKLQSRLKEIS